MKAVIRYFVYNSKMSHLILLIFLLIGCLIFYGLPKQLQPEMNVNLITITTAYPNQNSETIEKLVTEKIEDAIKGLKRYESMKSKSTNSLSVVSLEVKKGVDLQSYKEELFRLISSISEFPIDLLKEPQISIFKNQSTPFIVALHSKLNDYSSLRKNAKKVKKHLENLPGIESIKIQNLRERRLIIELDYRKMQMLNISVQTVIQKLKNYNIRVSVGKSESVEDQKVIKLIQEINSLEALETIIIQTNFESKTVYLGDIATLKHGFEKESLHSLVNGELGLLININGSKGVDVFKLEKRIQKQLDLINSGLSDSQLTFLINPVDFLNPMYQTVVVGVIIAIFAVVLALGLILDFSTALWTALGIPFSILFCFIAYPMLDLKFHFITLFTFIIITGMLVDDAIIVAENIFRLKEEGLDQREAAVEGSYEMLGPILAIVITTVLGFLPILFLPDPFGSFLGDMPFIVALCLIGSLIECFLILPTHLQYLKPKSKQNKIQKALYFFKGLYESAIKLSLSYKKLSLCVFVLITTFFLCTYLAFGKFEFMSQQEPEYFEVVYALQPGTGLQKTKNASKILSDIAHNYQKKNKIKQYVSVSGAHLSLSNEEGTSVQESLGTLYGFFPNAKEAKFDLAVVSEAFKQKVLSYKDLFYSLVYKNITGGPPSVKEIHYDFMNYDKNTLIKFSKKFESYLNTLESLSQVKSSYQEDDTGITIRIDYEKVQRLGVNMQELSSLLRIAYTGIELSGYREADDKVDFWIRFPPEIRQDWKALDSLTVMNKKGYMINLKQLIRTEKSLDQEMIMHKNAMPVITVTADIKKGIKSSKAIYDQIDSFIESNIQYYPNTVIEKEGALKRDAESIQKLLLGFSVASFGIYVVLCVLFNSFLQPFLMMIVIPLIFLGVAGLKTLHGMPMTFSSLIGCLGAMGVVINDSVLMTHALNKMILKNQYTLSDFAIATGSRFRPIILTSITTTLTLLPVAYTFPGLKIDTYLVSLAFSLMWGIIIGTLVTLFVIPLLFRSCIKKC